MKARARRKSRILFSATFAALIATSAWGAQAQSSGPNSGIEVRAVSAGQEQYERDVDAVALSSQQQAISKLTSLLRKYTNTSQEPVLLAKLADLQSQAASIQFRLTYGRSRRGAVDLGRFKKSMGASIRTLSTLIAKYPSYVEISHAYFMRGKGYEQIDQKDPAAKDYSYLVNRFPDCEDAIPAYMSLAEFAIAANNYPKAIGYLKEIEKRPEDPHYPFALYKLAWSYYNLKDIPQALHYVETQIHFYDAQRAQAPNDSSAQSSDGTANSSLNSPLNSDDALRENTLLDATVFYFEGYEETPSKHSPQAAFGYFRDLDTSKGFAPVLGKMYLRYSKLLRSHAHDIDLITWNNLVLQDELAGKHPDPQALDVVINTYEHVRDRRNWSELKNTADDIVALYNYSKTSKAGAYPSMPKAQQLLLDTAKEMQATIVKNKASDEAKALSGTLASIYFAFVKVVDETDPRIPGVHYNLAETLFAVQDYENATAHYRWIVDHGNWRKPKVEGSNVSMAEASLKAIASRYEVLEKNQLIPKTLNAISLGKDSKTSSIPPTLQEWVSWIDELQKHRPGNGSVQPEAENDSIDNFVFEAARALYAQGHVADAVQRLNDFAESRPRSRFAIPAASLIIDTYVATADWGLLLQKSNELRDIDEWKNTPFSQRLFAVSAQASYKLVEAKAHQKDYPGTIAGIDAFLKTYSKSALLGDALTLAGTAAMESHQDDLAMKYFSRLIREAPGSTSIKDALLSRAQIEENRYSLSAAANDYRAYLKVTKKADSALQKKILELIWIDGDPKALKAALASKDLCDDSTADQCERYQALEALRDPSSVDLDDAFKKARKENGELAGLWAIVSLQQAHDLAFRDRLLAIRHAASHWDDFDPLVKLAVLPYLNESIPRALAMNRKMMDEVAPLRAPSADSEEKYIAHRIDVMREMENAVTVASKLPWARIKAGTMNELAGTYIEFSQALSAVQPKGLKPNEIAIYQDTVKKITIPFEEKGEDLRSKAFEMASQFAIEEPDLQAISRPFFADNPSQAKKYKKTAQVHEISDNVDLGIQFMDTVDHSTGWKEIQADSSEEKGQVSRLIAREFIQSLNAHRWAKLGYMLQQAQARSAFSAPVLAAMRAVSMASLGAQAEGLLELDRSREQWQGKTKIFILTTLSQYFERSFAFDQAQSLQKEIEAELNPKPAPSNNPKGQASS